MKKIKLPPGFTLTETLIAILLLALIILLVLSVYLVGQRAYRQTDDRAELTQNGRVILDRLERELRQAKEIITALPPDNSNPDLLPHEIMFEDGHDITVIRYLRYYLQNTDLRRQLVIYYFATDPEVYVHSNDTDPYGQPPSSLILEDNLVGEFVTTLNFYGSNPSTLELQLTKNARVVNLLTKFYGRNL